MYLMFHCVLTSIWKNYSRTFDFSVSVMHIVLQFGACFIFWTTFITTCTSSDIAKYFTITWFTVPCYLNACFPMFVHLSTEKPNQSIMYILCTREVKGDHCVPKLLDVCFIWDICCMSWVYRFSIHTCSIR